MHAPAHRGGAPRSRYLREHHAPRSQARRQGSLGARARIRRRCADEGILAFEPGGGGADVPGGVAFAHPRHANARPSHPRQARARGLGRACRREPFLVRQRVRLGLADHRQARRDPKRARNGGIAYPRGCPRRRTRDPPGDGPGDAPPWPPVRDRPNHRGGAAALRGRSRLAAFSIPSTC